jgi:hypothetical protein
MRPAPTQDRPRDLDQEMRDAGQEVRTAQDKLLAVERRLAVLEDESAPIFAAMASFAGAMHRTSETTRLALEEVKTLAPSKNDVRQAMAQAFQNNLPHIAQNMRLSLMLMMACLLLAAMLIGAGAGWWLHSPPSEMVCADQADGSRICWLYQRLATPQLQKKL